MKKTSTLFLSAFAASAVSSQAATIYTNTFTSATERADLTSDATPAGPFQAAANQLTGQGGPTTVTATTLNGALTGAVGADGVLTIDIVFARTRADRDVQFSLVDSSGATLLIFGSERSGASGFDITTAAGSATLAISNLSNSSRAYDSRLVYNTADNTGEIFFVDRGGDNYNSAEDTFLSDNGTALTLVSAGTFDLGTATPTNLATATGVGFRTDGGGTAMDDVTVDFTPAVPEPSSALLSLAGVALLGLRRRK